MSDTVAGIGFELGLNTNSIDKAIKNTANIVSTKLTSAFSSAVKSSESKISDVANSINQTTDSTKAKIEQILSDTERSAKSKVASVAGIYRQQGMNRSEAMRQAWLQIERTNKEVNNSQTKQSGKSWFSIAKQSQNGSKKIGKSFDDISQKAKKSAQSMTNSFGGAFKKIAGAAAAVFSVAAVVKFGKDCISVADEVENAWVGLNSIINGQGKSFDNAKKFIKKYISDGLVPLNNAVTAYKNLSLRGYSEEQIQSVMTAFKNSATFARQSQYSLGDAISTATEGLKNENSVVVDNAGVTKNVAKMWEDYAKSIGVSTTSLTKQQKIEAEVAGIIEETKFQMGDAAKYADTYSGKVAKLNTSFTNLKVKLGNIIKAFSGVFIPVVNMVITAIDKLADKITNALNSFGIKTDITDTLLDVSDMASDLSASTDDTAQGMSDTTKEAKKLQKALAGFDQLNILSAESSSSNDSSSSDSTPTTTTATSVPSTATNLKSNENAYNKFGDTVKKVFDKINKATEPVRKSLSKLKEQFDRLGKFSWEGLKDFYYDFLKPIGNWVLGEGLPRFIDAISTMMSNIDWSKINSALDELWKALEPFAENVGEGLLWLFEEVLTPLGSWTMNEVVPVFLGILAETINILNGVIEALKPLGQWLFDNFLRPIAEWTGGVIVTVLNGVKDALEKVSDWIKNNSGVVQGMTITVGAFFAAWKSVELMSFIQQSGGLIKVLKLLKGATLGVVAAKLKDKAETIALKLLYAKDFITGFVKKLNLAKIATTAMSGAQAILNAVMNANPISIIIIAVAGLVTAIISLWNNCEWFREGWTTVWNGICSVAETVWNAITGFFTGAWDNICTAWNGVTGFFTGIWSGIQGAFSAVGTWFSDIFTKAWNGIKKVFEPVKNFFCGIWDGIKGAFSTVTNWFGDTFSKAWSAVKNVFSIGGKIFEGIKDGILSAFKFVVNGIIDGLNWVIAQPFNGINNALKIIKGLDFWGWKPFDWLGEIPVPQIPKLAKGGLATAPTLAMVGDNKNAQSDPEVIAPLSKLKSMLGETQDTTAVREVLQMLRKIYDLLSNEETQYINNIYLDSDVIERKLVKVRKRKSRRYGGATT